jgi:Uma2 family endonuclease
MSTVLDSTPPATPRRRPRAEPLKELLFDLQQGQYITVSDVPWSDYELLLDFRDAHLARAWRLTYDDGRLTLMAIGGRHESWKNRIARLIETMATGFNAPLLGLGSVTIRRRSLRKGFEPDQCYYTRRADDVRAVVHRRDLDFETDPPPDLAIEVEITRDVGGKLPLYAAMGIAEVWRWDGERLTFLRLTATGGYTEQATSPTFPGLTAEVVMGYLARFGTVDDTALFREVFAWADAARTAAPTPPPETA